MLRAVRLTLAVFPASPSRDAPYRSPSPRSMICNRRPQALRDARETQRERPGNSFTTHETPPQPCPAARGRSLLPQPPPTLERCPQPGLRGPFRMRHNLSHLTARLELGMGIQSRATPLELSDPHHPPEMRRNADDL
jgi:hypothetical protein